MTHDEARREALAEKLADEYASEFGNSGLPWRQMGPQARSAARREADFILSREAPLLAALERAFSRLWSLRHNPECGHACQADAAHIESVLKAHRGGGVVDPPPMTPEHAEDVAALMKALEKAIECAKWQFEMRTKELATSPPGSLFGDLDAALAAQRAREAARAPKPARTQADVVADLVAAWRSGRYPQRAPGTCDALLDELAALTRAEGGK